MLIMNDMLWRGMKTGGRAEWNDQPWHVRFADTLPSSSTLLDLGCGSGAPVAQYMAGRGFQVTGVDPSPTLILLCRQRLPEHEWHVGDMRTTDLGRSFSGVLAWDSFFHLPPDDQRHMFSVFDRHTAASGVLMFNSGPRFGEGLGEYWGDPLYHASLDPDEYRALLSRSGFVLIDHAVEDWKTGGGRTVWLARRESRR